MNKTKATVLGVLIHGVCFAANATPLPDVETISLGQATPEVQFADDEGPNRLQAWFRKVNTLQAEVQELRGVIEEQHYLIQQLTKKQKTLYLDLDKRLTQVTGEEASVPQATLEEVPDYTSQAASDIAVRAASAVVAQPTEQTAESNYQYAYDLIKAKSYDKAITVLEKHLVMYPESPYIPNVYYWLGEVYLVKKAYDQAAMQFQRVATYYPRHAKASDAQLKLGYVDIEQGNYQSAKARFQALQQDFPQASAARLAGAKLQQLKQTGKI